MLRIDSTMERRSHAAFISSAGKRDDLIVGDLASREPGVCARVLCPGGPSAVCPKRQAFCGRYTGTKSGTTCQPSAIECVGRGSNPHVPFGTQYFKSIEGNENRPKTSRSRPDHTRSSWLPLGGM